MRLVFLFVVFLLVGCSRQPDGCRCPQQSSPVNVHISGKGFDVKVNRAGCGCRRDCTCQKKCDCSQNAKCSTSCDCKGK